jgi:hypothetical protein
MKVDIKPVEVKPVTFPCLMKSNATDDIVLFEKTKCGTILQSKYSDKIGLYSSDLLMTNFTLFDGEIILEN